MIPSDTNRNSAESPTSWRIVAFFGVIALFALIGCSKTTAPQSAPENPPSVAAVSPAQEQVAELQAKVKKWEDNRAKLTKLIASMEKDQLQLLKQIDDWESKSGNDADNARRVKVLTEELADVLRKVSVYKTKSSEYDFAILKSSSTLRTIERQIAAQDAGVSETELAELTRTMLSLDESLNAQDAVNSVTAALDDTVAKRIAEYRASKEAETAKLQAQLKTQAEMAASKATIIVTVTPPDAKILVSGNGVTVTGSGTSRVVTIDNPMGEYRLIATMDGYKPLDLELKPEKGSTRSSSVTLESMKPVVSAVPPTDEFISTRKKDAENSPPTDATLFQGHYYKVFKEAGLDWKTARKRCEEIGGHLVTITYEQENKFIAALAAKTLGDINNSGIWLGASDERNEGRWEWIDGTPFKYSAWSGDQPNGKESENFLLLLLSFRGQDGKEIRGWCDQPQSGKHHVIYYACEWDSPRDDATQSQNTTPAGNVISLFDGKTLSGWHGNKSLWSVKDGAIVGSYKSPLAANSFLVSDKKFRNFTLRLKFQLSEGNSGVQIRSVEKPKGAVLGPQSDIAFDDFKWLGCLTGELMTPGIIAATSEDTKQHLRTTVDTNGWNDMTIIVNEQSVSIQVNGHTTIDVTSPSIPNEPGVIALQLHSGKAMTVKFKDITLERLP